MEPITFVVTALTLGFAAGLKPTAEQAIKDAYAGLKQLVEDRYKVNLSGLEGKPDSEVQIAAVEESLVDAEADKDDELLDKAKELLELTKKHAPETATAKGIDFEKVSAGYIKAKRITAIRQAEAVRMRNVTVEAGIEIEDITADSGPSDPKA